MRFLFLTLVLATSAAAWGQKAPIKFGDIPMGDMEMKVYAKDTSASAVVLADYGESSLVYSQNDGFTLKFERITRIKILTRRGLEYANFAIPLYHSGTNHEKLVGLKAVTYNLENGKIVETKMKNDGVFKEKFDANFEVTKVTLPNVKEGSIIEISYSVNSDFLFNFQDWEFQGEIPKRWSEYRARIPEYFHYDKYMQGYVTLDVNEEEKATGVINISSKETTGTTTVQTTFSNDKIEYQVSKYRWAAQDIPAFKPEPFIAASANYISKINFELSFTKFPNQGIKNYMGSWADINREFWESADFGGEVIGNGFLKKTVDEILEGISEPERMTIAISNFVRDNIAWDGYKRRFTTKPLRKVLEEKKGNSAEINLLLTSMLHKAGIKANPVLVSTRDHGFVREQVPVSSQFNYVICLATINGKQILLDATEKLLPPGGLSERCLNGKGFVVADDEYGWINLQSNMKSRQVSNATLVLGGDGVLSGKLQIERAGLEGLSGRRQYLSKSESDYVKDFVGTKPWEISSKEVMNSGELTQPFKEVYELTISDAVVMSGDIMYINPIVFGRLEENPFKIEEREYPVDFSSPFDRVYMCRITLPENFMPDELPKPKIVSLPEGTGKYTYSVTLSGNVLSVVSNLQINRSIFSQDEYPGLREFYNQMLAKQAEQIVLKKK